MKTKVIAISTLLILLTSLIMVNQTIQAQESFIFASGGPGGLWMQIGTVLGEGWADEIDEISDVSPTPGGGASNPVAISQGNADIGLGLSALLVDAWAGEGEYESYPDGVRDIIALGRLNQVGMGHFAVRKSFAEEHNLETVSDLVEAKPEIRLSAGTRGMADEVLTRKVIEFAGWSFDGIQETGGRVIFTDFADGADRMADGHIDAIGFFEVPGDPATIELTEITDVVFLHYDAEEEGNVVKGFQEMGYMPATIPAGTYNNQDEDIITAGQDNIVLVREDMSEDLAYKMTKVLLENKERWANSHAVFRTFEPSLANENVPIPLHPGAEKAFEELGY